jgi:hypothetical protein
MTYLELLIGNLHTNLPSNNLIFKGLEPVAGDLSGLKRLGHDKKIDSLEPLVDGVVVDESGLDFEGSEEALVLCRAVVDVQDDKGVFGGNVAGGGQNGVAWAAKGAHNET